MARHRGPARRHHSDWQHCARRVAVTDRAVDAGQQLDLRIVDAAAEVVETLHRRRRGLRGALRRLGNTLGDLGWPLEQLNEWLARARRP